MVSLIERPSGGELTLAGMDVTGSLGNPEEEQQRLAVLEASAPASAPSPVALSTPAMFAGHFDFTHPLVWTVDDVLDPAACDDLRLTGAVDVDYSCPE